LNIPSMQSNSCMSLDITGTISSNTCSFTRFFRTTQNHTVTWTAAFSGVSATATPATLSVHSGANPQPITVTVDATGFASDDTFHFGEMTLTPDDTTLPTLHLPIAVKVPAPAIAVTPSSLTIDIPHSKTTKDGTLTVTNTGGPTLDVSNTNDTVSFAPLVVLDQASQGNFGDYSDLFVDISEGIYMAEDFQVTGASTNLSKLSFPGFVTGSTSLAGYAGNNIHFEIYADNAGIPNGNPETVAPSYVWNYVATIGSTTGLSVSGNTITIDLVAAGATATALPAGTYWVVAYPETNYFDSGWAQFESVTTFGNNAHVINPLGDFGFGTNWTDITDPSYGDTNPGMAVHIEASVPCGAPWLTTNPPTMSIGGLLSAPLTVTADSTQFGPIAAAPATPGISRSAYLCIDSNDANNPVVAVPVTATQH